MLRRIPYNSNLISIGNANHYDGEYVYSDGHVAYGWQYTPQHIIRFGSPHESLDGGIFTNTWTNPTHTGEYYRDGNKMLLLDDNLTWSVTGDAQGFEEYFYGTMYYYCYPWLADYNAKRMFTHDKSYNYVGKILAMDGNGNLLTFEATWDSDISWYVGKLHNYDEDGHDTVTRLDEVEDDELCDYLLVKINNYYNHGLYSTMDSGLPFQLSTTNGTYITKATPGANLPLYLGLSWWHDSYHDPDPNVSVNDYYIFYEYNDNHGEYAAYLPDPLTMFFRFNFELYINSDYYMYIIPKSDITEQEFQTYFYDLKVPFITNTYEHYFCGNGNISRVSTFPSTLTLSPNVTMRLSDLGLIVNKNNNSITYPNDPLDLLPKIDYYNTELDYFINPTRVYAYNDIVLCAQDGREYNNFNGFVWRDGNKVVNQNNYTNITSCYSASWIPDGKWIV